MLLNVKEQYKHLPIAEEVPEEEYPKLARVFIDHVPKSQQNRYLLEPTKNPQTSIMTNTCSWKCCSPNYPPQDFNTKFGASMGPESEYVPSNYMCMSEDNNTGCMCMKKQHYQTLVNRAGNR